MSQFANDVELYGNDVCEFVWFKASARGHLLQQIEPNDSPSFRSALMTDFSAGDRARHHPMVPAVFCLTTSDRTHDAFYNHTLEGKLQ